MKNKKFVWLMGMVLALGTVSGCGSDKAADTETLSEADETTTEDPQRIQKKQQKILQKKIPQMFLMEKRQLQKILQRKHLKKKLRALLPVLLILKQPL